jgi:hypothetical protein
VESNESRLDVQKKPHASGLAKASLYCGVAAFVLGTAKSVAFYYYVNSGGLNRVAANTWGPLFFAYPASWAIALIIVSVSFVFIPFRKAKVRNLIVSSVALAVIACSFEVHSYTAFGFGTKDQVVRYVAHNILTVEALEKLQEIVPRYCKEHEGQLPSTDSRYDALGVARERDIDRLALNKHIRGMRLTELPGDVVLLFEVEPGTNSAGGPELITPDNHYGKGSLVLFADLHLEFVRAEDFDDLRWKP